MAFQKIKGVLTLFTAKDIPGVNSFTAPGLQLQTEEEEILVSKEVKFYGQPVAVIVADSEFLAAKAATMVKVTYKNISKPPILTIDEAKKHSNRYIPSENKIDPKDRGNNVKTVIKGVYEIGAQYHYYLEPITSVVTPVDRGLEIQDSTQWMNLLQIAVARSLQMNESE